MGINYLGNPSAQEIADLQTYLSDNLLRLGRLVIAKQNEIDSLRVTLADYLASEATLNAQLGVTVHDFSLADYIKEPVDNVEDIQFLDTLLYDGIKTSNIIHRATLPFRDTIKLDLETITYKIKKIRYLLEVKLGELAILNLPNQGVTDG